MTGDRRYADVAIPASESLKDTIARVLPYFENHILPALVAGERVIVAAHGNSLRALEKQLSGISDSDIVGLEIPTGQPIVYELDEMMGVTDATTSCATARPRRTSRHTLRDRREAAPIRGCRRA